MDFGGESLGFSKSYENRSPNSPSKRNTKKRPRELENDSVQRDILQKRERIIAPIMPVAKELFAARIQPGYQTSSSDLETLLEQADFQFLHQKRRIYIQCAGETLKARACYFGDKSASYKRKEVDFIIGDEQDAWSVVKYVKLPAKTLINPKPSFKTANCTELSDSDPLLKALKHASKIKEYLGDLDVRTLLVFDITAAGQAQIPARCFNLLCKQLQARLDKMPNISAPQFSVMLNHNGFLCLTDAYEFAKPERVFFQPAEPRWQGFMQRLNLLMEITSHWPTNIDVEDECELEECLSYFKLLQTAAQRLYSSLQKSLQSNDLSELDSVRLPVLLQQTEQFNASIKETARSLGLFNQQLQANFR